MSNIYLDLAKLITSSLDFDEILNRLMQEIERLFKPANWSLLRYDPASQELFFIIAHGIDSNALKGLRLKLGEGIAGTVAKTQKTLIIDDVTKDKRFSEKVDKTTGFTTRSIIATPLIFQKQTLGVLEIVNTTIALDKEKISLLETIADFSAIAFNNAALFQSTLVRAEYDPLTGVYNRGKLNSLIDFYLNVPSFQSRNIDRYDYICVAILDIDGFKKINDNFGHPYGDKVLQQLARELMINVRHSDMVFRIGGDEFLIIAENFSQEDEDYVSQTLTNKLEKINVEFHMAHFSYGVCCGKKRDVKRLIGYTDQAMYQAKKGLKF